MTRLRCAVPLISCTWSQQRSRVIPRRHPGRTCCTDAQAKHEHLIRHHTRPTRHHMTPEVVLYLITKDCPLWSDKRENSPFADPFWAFYWPGGQVLTRYVLDNPEVFRGHVVLDVGSGCGASAIAARMVGASHVLANDIDPVSIAAIRLNMKENEVSLETSSANMIGQFDFEPTTILIGDMFYDDAFRDKLVHWLSEYVRRYNTNVFIGDPGRIPLVNHPIKSKLTKCATYELLDTCKEENNGLSTGFVWKLTNT